MFFAVRVQKYLRTWLETELSSSSYQHYYSSGRKILREQQRNCTRASASVADVNVSVFFAAVLVNDDGEMGVAAA